MAHIIPFSAMRFDKNTVGDLSAVTAPPYDVISPEQQEKLYDRHPFNVVRLELGKQLDDDDEYNNKYTRSRNILTEWLESGILQCSDDPSVYIYGREFTLNDGRTLFCKGIMCLVRLEDIKSGVILPHENTAQKGKTDRYNLMCETGANFSAVYSLYTDSDKIIADAVNSVAINTPPETEFCDDESVCHRIWRIDDDETILKIQNAFKNKQLFIADGHHRYAAALNYRNMMRDKNPAHTGEEPYNFILMFLAETSDPGLVVFPAHRLVKNIPDFDETAVITQLKENFFVEKTFVSKQAGSEIEVCLTQNLGKKIFAMYTGKDYYYTLVLKNTETAKSANPDKSEAYSCLDVTVLHTLVLDKIFGIDKESLQADHNLVYTCDFDRAAELAQTTAFQCAFFLNPPKISEICDIAAACETVPQKTTYFYPKIITGMIMNKF